MRNEAYYGKRWQDSLLDSGRRGKAMTGANKACAVVASRHDQGKNGRCARTKLGKRDVGGARSGHRGRLSKLRQCANAQADGHRAVARSRSSSTRGVGAMGIATAPSGERREVKAGTPVVWDGVWKRVESAVLRNNAPTLLP